MYLPVPIFFCLPSRGASKIRRIYRKQVYA
jgi:hypothetical protein